MSGERVLVAGWVNSPHVVAWGELLLELGYEVHLAGQLVERWPATPDPGRFASVRALAPGSVPGIRDRRIGRALAQVARELRPDLVHAHFAPAYGWMAARAGLQPLVTSVWGSDVLLANRRLAARSRRALRASQLVLADSEHLAAATQRLGGGRVEVVQWGVDTERFHPAPRAPGPPVILSTRALDPIYNPEVLLDAVARVPDARLILKHPGSELPESIAARVDALGLRDVTRVVGFVGEDELADLYRAADVYVSIPSSDSSPRSVWEAMACGTPVVVSDLPWAREALRDGDNALLVPVDAAAVAAAIEHALAHPDIGDRGRRLVEATMSRHQHRARVDALYRALLG